MIRQRVAEYKSDIEETFSSIFFPESDIIDESLDAVATSKKRSISTAKLSRPKRATITADNPLLLGRSRRKIPNPISGEQS
jgi:hypothetical protein